MSVRIAINGFGRIGRAALKAALNNKNLEVVGINDIVDNKTLAHLLQYDTVYGEFPETVRATKDSLMIGKKKIPVSEVRKPEKLPWGKLKVDVAIESTGVFRKAEDLKKHLQAGAKKVLLSAPAKSGGTQTLVFGTQETKKNLGQSDIVNNASCTTNCISPVVQVLHSRFGVEKALMTTIHGYTSDQRLVDAPHKDLRRARAAAVNIIPTTTGAAIATTHVIPELKGLFDGTAIRVPVPVGSISDITLLLKRKKVTVKQINDEFKKAVNNPLYKNILEITNKPIVSSDIVGNPHSAIVDLELTQVAGGNLVKVFAWYDNEWGYANRLVEMAEALGRQA
ncbi:MAG: type I glyceraldehyde-3-phosphate dehydrogenase [Candidatus Buchananbacteria bacterium CG10_big_fil_rev_8_21_14_0_10_42_9]|uniref:Glyceraldehyde-3-phosphate dehydrogenase n=1 Tax=Candidatus Buchananbacteria bacterium CG10_big_fil_rev_8_21_14_0_10_42_9 TaxID=1974526 RepID=A0A2H0W2M0_9BACT|nr:MAG: type I glyceraldehyde-3-phosphate dehydrogenase [Candidatus Buchananbacteria bacterium CG10_big_fil_rev_8_21_14_0_10_42_9]